MLNFFKSLLGYFTHPIEDLWHKILGLFAAVYSYFDRLWNDLERGIVAVTDKLVKFAEQVGHYIVHQIDSVIKFVKNEFSAVVKWAVKQLDRIASYANAVYKWALRQFDNIIGEINSTVKAITRWVIANIYDPLTRDIRTALNWITHTGADMWDLVSHPDKLVAWLAVYLLKAWLGILRRWSIPITAYILHTSRLLIPDFISILEDVISKVL